MSTTREHTIWCDDADCGAWIQLSEHQLAKARAQARKAGWSCSRETGRFGMANGRDFCPRHKVSDRKVVV